MARRRAQGQQTRNARLRLHTPPPVAGRKHETVQTERYLEEVSQTTGLRQQFQHLNDCLPFTVAHDSWMICFPTEGH